MTTRKIDIRHFFSENSVAGCLAQRASKLPGLLELVSAKKTIPAFGLPPRRAGSPTSECRRDRPNRIAPWLLAGRRSLHLATHVS
jgi:hypothetical protein